MPDLVFDRILICYMMMISGRQLILCCMIISLCVAQEYTVIKKRVDRPIPYTIQYYLTDSSGA
jgi:hypothetical protein